MNTHIETHSEDRIDLGAVATETRGNLLDGVQDDPQIPFQCRKSSLSAD